MGRQRMIRCAVGFSIRSVPTTLGKVFPAVRLGVNRDRKQKLKKATRRDWCSHDTAVRSPGPPAALSWLHQAKSQLPVTFIFVGRNKLRGLVPYTFCHSP